MKNINECRAMVAVAPTSTGLSKWSVKKMTVSV